MSEINNDQKRIDNDEVGELFLDDYPNKFKP